MGETRDSTNEYEVVRIELGGSLAKIVEQRARKIGSNIFIVDTFCKKTYI